ncbi:MAG: restriction endonuclease subunit S [Candidatus Acidiferrales bacterium]|jgi:type I restriction enzyme S subunit
MKNGWIRTPLSEVAAVQSGAGFPDRYQGHADREIPFYKVSDMNIAGNEHEMVYENNSITEEVRRKLRAFLFPKGSTIFPKIGGAIATNKKRLTTRDCCVDNNVMGVIPRPGKIESDFLFYFFLAHDLSEFANEAHLPSIKKTVVESWPIILPASLPEQHRIVGILDEAFEGIATAKANAEKNLQNARALFESHLQSVFADAWRTCELVRLSDLASEITDGDHLPPPKSPTGVPFITIGNIVKQTRKIDFADTFMVPHTYFNALRPNKKPKKGDVLYTVTGSFGIPVMVSETVEFCFQRHIGLIRPKSETSSTWLYYLLLSPQVFKQANDGATGTAQKTVSLKLLRNFEVPKVTPKQQLSAVAKLDTLSTETQRLATIYEHKLATLEALRKSLLHQAFAGQL